MVYGKPFFVIVTEINVLANKIRVFIWRVGFLGKSGL